MSARLDALAQERELLVARAALGRLRLRLRTQALRDSLSWRSAAVAAAAAPPVRRLAFDLVLAFVGAPRAARAIGLASRALSLARIVRAVACLPLRASTARNVKGVSSVGNDMRLE